MFMTDDSRAVIVADDSSILTIVLDMHGLCPVLDVRMLTFALNREINSVEYRRKWSTFGLYRFAHWPTSSLFNGKLRSSGFGLLRRRSNAR